MTVQLDHTIVHARDEHETARHLVELLGLPEPTAYAFLVPDDEFDAIHGRIRDRGMDWWADPFPTRPREINTVPYGG